MLCAIIHVRFNELILALSNVQFGIFLYLNGFFNKTFIIQPTILFFSICSQNRGCTILYLLVCLFFFALNDILFTPASHECELTKVLLCDHNLLVISCNFQCSVCIYTSIISTTIPDT